MDRKHCSGFFGHGAEKKRVGSFAWLESFFSAVLVVDSEMMRLAGKGSWHDQL
jgi:hypothetical protein